MTDLLDVIPDFPSAKYQHIITGLEAYFVTTSDLLASDAIELARRAHLPVIDLQLFVKDVIDCFHKGYGLDEKSVADGASDGHQDRKTDLASAPGLGYTVAVPLISTLDDHLDTVLKGGIAPGYVTEVTGESGAGKTQFLLTLLLSCQLPAPQGLAKGTIYISTEHALPTQRLQYIIKSNPKLRDCYSPPTLGQILSIQIPDLETQDHILTYQLPVAIRSRNIGLVVIDSIAANYRAEVETSKSNDSGKSQAKALAARAIELIRTGALLQSIAQKYRCAVVVANQVSDRFERQSFQPHLFGSPMTVLSHDTKQQESDHAIGESSKSLAPQASANALPKSSPFSNISSSPLPSQNWSTNQYARPPSPSLVDPRLTLDHQMRFFTGWGDSAADYQKALKTPALGLTWTNQISCRIVISRESSLIGRHGVLTEDTGDRREQDTHSTVESGLGGADWSKKRWRRWMKVVFAAWAPGAEEDDKGVEFEIWDGGLRSVVR